MTNKFQSAILGLFRARESNRNVQERLKRHDKILKDAARMLKEATIRPYGKKPIAKKAKKKRVKRSLEIRV